MGSAGHRLDISRQLAYRDGRWILETSELVAMDRNVLRPRARRLVGADAILRHLEATDPRLMQGALTLMRGADEYGERRFRLQHGEWVPVEVTGSLDSDDDSVDALRALVLEMRAELLMVRASHQRLRQRVAELERHRHFEQTLGVVVSRGPERAPPAIAENVSLGRRLGRARSESPPAEFVEPASSEGSAAVSAGGRADDAPAAAEKPDDAAREPFARLNMPPPQALFECLEQLIGSTLGAEVSTDPLQQLQTAAHRLYVSTLLDDESNPVGAFVLDTRATAELGGTLLGIPGPGIREQIESGEASTDAVEAASEICNNLSGVVNRVSPDCHVRTQALCVYTPGAVEWLAVRPARSLCVAVGDGGRMWLVFR
jgi:hypothetical protein